MWAVPPSTRRAQDRLRRAGVPKRRDRRAGLGHRQHRAVRDEGELRPARTGPAATATTWSCRSTRTSSRTPPTSPTPATWTPTSRTASTAYYEPYLTGRSDAPPGGHAQHAPTPTPSAATVRYEGHDTSGPTTDEAMTRSEEQLQRRHRAGRGRPGPAAQVRRHRAAAVTCRCRARRSRRAGADHRANRGDALSGADISEEEHEVILHAERPVVATEAVPVERVRLGTETVTEEQTVTGEVRKEQIEVRTTPTEGLAEQPHRKPLTAQRCGTTVDSPIPERGTL